MLYSGEHINHKPWSEEKDGFLIGEFLDQLKKLPAWDKTLYYCFFSELLDIKTGRKLTADRLHKCPSRMNTHQPKQRGLKPAAGSISD